MKTFDSRLCFLIVILLTLFLGQEAWSQRITPQEPELEERSARNQMDRTRGKTLIYPEEDLPGVSRTSSRTKGTTEGARMQKLQADSAAMRVEFEERLNELRSDSVYMRNRIQRLSQEIQQLKSRMSRLEQAGSGTRTQTLRRSEGESTQMQGDRDFETESSSRPLSPEVQYNPNTASLKDLASIPGLDERLARRIEWYRREVRPFSRRDDLMKVPGIDRGVYGQIAPYFHSGPYS